MAITTSRTGAHIVGKGNETASGPGPYIMASSTLEGDHVFSSDNEDVGKIKEVMLDVERGKIAYAVMSCGGFLGIGDKLLALPWAALTLDTTHKCFVLNVTSEHIKNAPGFDKDHWPAMADIGWATTLHEYYGARVHWEDEPVAQTGPAQSTRRPEPPEAGGVKL
ncbi:PRC-barrel domain-containing protein [Paraburkholderia sacchari]|uniref:PRC-barrel domain-containing protein n=1 Tax=Paraburkholderia sacchari TaxID=159450 RepID=UPI001BCE1355|nr:PRC-barrel domain-containing protein [Paraburkholderia sacchari]